MVLNNDEHTKFDKITHSYYEHTVTEGDYTITYNLDNINDKDWHSTAYVYDANGKIIKILSSGYVDTPNEAYRICSDNVREYLKTAGSNYVVNE